MSGLSILILGCACLVAVWGIAQVVRTRSLARRRDALWEAISTALRERQNLAPRMAAIASLYIPWNDPLVDDIAVARRKTIAAGSVTEQALTEAELSWALARLILAAEQRSELTRHADFYATIAAIEAVEAQVARLRSEYNRVAIVLGERVRNRAVRMLAALVGVEQREPFELDPLLARQAMIQSIQSGRIPRIRVA